jgi:CRISPR-associated protein Cas6/Cse3/CasE subtype I-E
MFLSIVPKPDTPEYCYHQYLWAYFDQNKNVNRCFVYRALSESIIMLSSEQPACEHTRIDERISAETVYQFDLIASPIRGVRREDGKRSRREPYRTNKERLDWLARRLGDSAELRFAQVFDRPRRRFKKADGHQVSVDECTMRGAVYVKDRDLFIDTLLTGVGGRGAWGCGLMILPEIMTCNP